MIVSYGECWWLFDPDFYKYLYGARSSDEARERIRWRKEFVRSKVEVNVLNTIEAMVDEFYRDLESGTSPFLEAAWLYVLGAVKREDPEKWLEPIVRNADKVVRQVPLGGHITGIVLRPTPEELKTLFNELRRQLRLESPISLESALRGKWYFRPSVKEVVKAIVQARVNVDVESRRVVFGDRVLELRDDDELTRVLEVTGRYGEADKLRDPWYERFFEYLKAEIGAPAEYKVKDGVKMVYKLPGVGSNAELRVEVETGGIYPDSLTVDLVVYTTEPWYIRFFNEAPVPAPDVRSEAEYAKVVASMVKQVMSRVAELADAIKKTSESLSQVGDVYLNEIGKDESGNLYYTMSVTVEKERWRDVVGLKFRGEELVEAAIKMEPLFTGLDVDALQFWLDRLLAGEFKVEDSGVYLFSAYAVLKPAKPVNQPPNKMCEQLINAFEIAVANAIARYTARRQTESQGVASGSKRGLVSS